jgi:hypothetical protein
MSSSPILQTDDTAITSGAGPTKPRALITLGAKQEQARCLMRARAAPDERQTCRCVKRRYDDPTGRVQVLDRMTCMSRSRIFLRSVLRFTPRRSAARI